MNKGIYRLKFDYGRMGVLTGIFIAEKEKVRVLVESGMEVYFGEVLGKHSEVYGPITKEEIEMVSDSPEAIKVIEELGLQNGYDPFEYTTTGFSLEGVDEVGDMSVDEICDKLLELENKSK